MTDRGKHFDGPPRRGVRMSIGAQIGVRALQCFALITVAPIIVVVFVVLSPMLLGLICWGFIDRIRRRRKLRRQGRLLSREEAIARLKSGSAILVIPIYPKGGQSGWLCERPADMESCPLLVVGPEAPDFTQLMLERTKVAETERAWLRSIQIALSHAAFVELGLGKWWTLDVPAGSMRVVYHEVFAACFRDV